MKRKSVGIKVQARGFKRKYVYLWKHCEDCKLMFKKEYGWRWKIYKRYCGLEFDSVMWIPHWLCEGCAPTEGAAANYILARGYHPYYKDLVKGKEE